MAKPQKRAVNGIVLLDKPVGMSSNRALQRVKHLYNARKAGHTGSLDPLASGVLPLCLGEATKVAGYLLDADKTYQVTIQLGATTTTGDAEGDIKAQLAIPELNEALLKKTLQSLEGVMEQIPPMYSAIKKEGQPLYKLARKGIEVDRVARKITLYACNLLNYDAESVTAQVKCSKGTYIRVFAEDFAQKLGTLGFVSMLRRVVAGPFDIRHTVSLDQLQAQLEGASIETLDQWLLPLEQALPHWPSVYLNKDASFYIRRGMTVTVTEQLAGGLIRLFNAEKCFLGIGWVDEDGRVAPKRLIND